MKNLLIRSLTGIIFVVAILGSLLFNRYIFLFLFFVFTIAGLLEFYSLSEKTGAKPQKVMGILTGIIVYSINAIINVFGDMEWLLTIIPFVFSIFIFELYRKSERPFNNIAYTLLGIIYVAVPFSFMTYYTNVIFKYILLGFFILIWTNDTFAYLTGMALGKHRLFERISPKKSWEGSIGGAIFALLAGYILSIYFQILTMEQWLIFSGIVIITGTFGDLTESMFKRSIDIKDSGSILPGHGGILDRFDATIMAAPFIFTFLKLFTSR
ncbi:MAG: phosphatidate cytidylyltransferase [Bacteroidota bacterium]|nr:phosphatidate cytidylyltransferase [Bacteroidota bacterium]